jgi:hypothetical protein
VTRAAVLLILAALVSPAHAAGPPPALPRLTGIVVGPDARAAIFADDTDGWTVLREGQAIGGWRIATIAPGQVTVVDRDGGALALTPTPRGQPAGMTSVAARPAPALPPAEANRNAAERGAAETGARLGRIAAAHDVCVGQGLLARTQRPAQAQLSAMLDTMGRAPPQADITQAADPSGAELGQAMRAAAQAASRQAEAVEYDVDRCARVDKEWRREAGRYGMR